MIAEKHLLTDRQIHDFIVNGFITVKTDLPPSFHQEVYTSSSTKRARPRHKPLPAETLRRYAAKGALRRDNPPPLTTFARYTVYYPYCYHYPVHYPSPGTTTAPAPRRTVSGCSAVSPKMDHWSEWKKEVIHGSH